MSELITFIHNNQALLWNLTLQHLTLVSISLLLAIFIGVSVGILINRYQILAQPILQIANTIMTIPSIALFGLMLPILGIIDQGLGELPALIALTVYSVPPIMRNTYTAIEQVEQALVDAARGIGLNTWQILYEVQLPLALPVIISGVQIAAVMNIGIAAIAVYIGAGGLGVLIQKGISETYLTMLLAGAVLVSLLAVIVEITMLFLSKLSISKGIRLQQQVRN
ncbi:MAG: osmoprotectant ABC transporter permease OsmW [Gammaproteobacteria bacterium]